MKFKKISFHFQFYAIDRDILFNSNLSPSSPLLSSPPPSESHSPFIDRYNNRDEKFHGTATNCELQTLRITEFNEIRPKAHPMEYFYLYVYIYFFFYEVTQVNFALANKNEKRWLRHALARVRACWLLAKLFTDSASERVRYTLWNEANALSPGIAFRNVSTAANHRWSSSTRVIPSRTFDISITILPLLNRVD